MKQIKWLFSGLLCCLCVQLWAEDSPVSMLENTADRIIHELETSKGNLSKSTVYRIVEKNLLPVVDVNGMARSVLGRQAWMKATPVERNQFAQAFTQLVIRTYAGPLADYSDEKVKFNQVKKDQISKRFLRVSSTIIRTKGNNIPLNYSLVSKSGQWKIYDFSVEGVSLLQSFRSQFSQALQNSSIQDVIRQMQERSKKAA